jgi:hypothetical protein
MEVILQHSTYLKGTSLMSIKKALHIATTLVLLITFSVTANAIPAKRLRVFTTGDKINPKKDHYSVEIVTGRISSRDNIFRALLSRNSSLVGSYEQSVITFDSTQTNVASIVQETDIGMRIDRPLSKVGVLFNNIPGDAQAHLTIRFAINREQRLTQIFDALQSGGPGLTAAADFFASQTAGYTKLALDIVNKVFGADRTRLPLTWDGDIKDSGVLENGEIKPHYIVLVSPINDRDSVVNNYIESKVTFDDGVAKHDGQPILDRSYIVLKVVKAQGYDIKALIDASTAPWAVFAKTQIINAPTTTITNVGELTTLGVGLLNQLKAEDALLQRELRFSGYDRALALVYFGERAQKQVQSACTRLTIAETVCPKYDIANFADDYIERQGINRNSSTATEIKQKANSLVQPSQ